MKRYKVRFERGKPAVTWVSAPNGREAVEMVGTSGACLAMCDCDGHPIAWPGDPCEECAGIVPEPSEEDQGLIPIPREYAEP